MLKDLPLIFVVQPEVWMDIEILKPSLYRLLYRYVNLNDHNVNGEIVLRPRNIGERSLKLYKHCRKSLLLL